MINDKDAYWFQHDSNASRDPKIRKLERHFGLAGYGFFWLTIEYLREQPDYCLSLEDLEILEEEKNISGISKFMLNIGLLVEKNEKIFSNSLVQRMKEWEKTKTKRKEAAKKAGLASGKKRNKNKCLHGEQVLNEGLTNVEQTLNECSQLTERTLNDFEPLHERREKKKREHEKKEKENINMVKNQPQEQLPLVTLASDHLYNNFENEKQRNEITEKTETPTLRAEKEDLSDKEAEQQDSNRTPKKEKVIKNEYSADFLEFWETYPRKSGKYPAMEAWSKLKKAKTLPDIEKIKRAAKLQHDEYTRKNPQDPSNVSFFRHAKTWLNQRGWEDETEQQKRQAYERPFPKE